MEEGKGWVCVGPVLRGVDDWGGNRVGSFGHFVFGVWLVVFQMSDGLVCGIVVLSDVCSDGWC